jgi:hypothetical protein
MSVKARVAYLTRVGAAYLGGATSQLSFWHETPAINRDLTIDELGDYYMSFEEKAEYAGPFDHSGIPLLDYRGALGRQYNPIAIAQYGLGNYNLWQRKGAQEAKEKVRLVAEWLATNLEQNIHGLPVWNHHFDWEYRTPLRAPWYSGLAQGQGISLLVRAGRLFEEARYKEAADLAFRSMLKPVSEGGVLFHDAEGNSWIEEYIVDPPTHILNGFMWALWGVHDYWLATNSLDANQLFQASVHTLKMNLLSYDTGFWSLYEHSGTRLKMIASPFYHRLHIVQLRVMARLTGDAFFGETASRWEGYTKSSFNRKRAMAQKVLFKAFYY